MKDRIRSYQMSLLCILAISVVTLQCESDRGIRPSLGEPDNTFENTLKEDIASRLAHVLDEEAVRSFLKEEANKRFDEDFDILFDEAARKQIRLEDGSQKTLSQMLFGEDATDKLAVLARQIPLLQISIPALPGNINPVTWDSNAMAPLVAYIPTGSDWDVLPAFDTKGNRYRLSRTETPNRLVILIGENERLITISKGAAERPVAAAKYACPMLQSQTYYSNDVNDYYLKTTYYDLCQDPSYPAPPPPPAAVTGCDRDTKTAKDNLNKMIFNSRSQFKKVSEWFDGGLDIEINIFFAQPNGALSKVTKFIHGADHDFNDCGLFDCDPEWFSINLEVVDWVPSVYGSAMLYNWIEKDPGSTTTYKTSFSSTYKADDGTSSTISNEVSLSITDKDDMLGESIVEYCDNTDGNGYLYNTGWIQFYVRQLY